MKSVRNPGSLISQGRVRGCNGELVQSARLRGVAALRPHVPGKILHSHSAAGHENRTLVRLDGREHPGSRTAGGAARIGGARDGRGNVCRQGLWDRLKHFHHGPVCAFRAWQRRHGRIARLFRAADCKIICRPIESQLVDYPVGSSVLVESGRQACFSPDHVHFHPPARGLARCQCECGTCGGQRPSAACGVPGRNASGIVADVIASGNGSRRS